MTDSADLKKALERADAACPCRLPVVPEHCAGPTRCDCCKDTGKPCLWPGHAAVREAMRAAAEWAYALEMRNDVKLRFALDAILGPPENK